MQKPSNLYIAIGVVFGILFFIGLGHLFMLRFKTGDIYPPYSSLRADPLGTMALYESLANTGSVDVRRHYESVTRLQSGHDITFFYLGSPATFFFSGNHSNSDSGDNLEKQLQRLAITGARVVISLIPPKEKKTSLKSSDEKCERVKKASEDDAADANKPQQPYAKIKQLASALISKPSQNISLKYDHQLEKSAGAHLSPAYLTSGLPSKKNIPWHSAWYFDVAGSSWKVIYSIDNRPVMIEHPFGDGTVILLTDTFLLSNEALRSKRHPRFLAWLMGPNSQAVFDEAHLGMRKRPGVVALARQNRLHWPIGGIILLAFLFIWKNAIPLTPPPEKSGLPSDGSTPSPQNYTSQDYTDGLISLLDRHIDKRQVLKTYVDQWLESLPRNQVPTAAKRKRIEAMFKEDGTLIDGQDPVATYHQIYAIISEE
ncbi:DUF4350 domain-containing protein [Desulfococcaceae bacterium HSG9]|nr:DUF4350 domain-containing protein [Desulfococcaceae bacterium HSG9]